MVKTLPTLPTPSIPEKDVSITVVRKGVGISGRALYQGKRWIWGKICTKHPDTHKPIVILLHRNSVKDPDNFHFKEIHRVKFNFSTYQGKLIATDVEFLDSGPKHIANKLKSKARKQPKKIISLEMFLAMMVSVIGNSEVGEADVTSIIKQTLDKENFILEGLTSKLNLIGYEKTD